MHGAQSGLNWPRLTKDIAKHKDHLTSDCSSHFLSKWNSVCGALNNELRQLGEGH